jgi:hypothetical protein
MMFVIRQLSGVYSARDIKRNMQTYQCQVSEVQIIMNRAGYCPSTIPTKGGMGKKLFINPT